MDNDSVSSHLISISQSLGQINSKLDWLAESYREHLHDYKKLEERVGKIENSQARAKYMVMGGAAVFSGLYKLIELWVKGGTS